MSRSYRHTAYPPATTEEIAIAEQRLGVKFCPDYKAFVQSENGVEFEEEIDYEDYGEWIYEVRTIYGIGPQQDGGMECELDGFFNRRFLPICYPIGVDGGGNLLVQIAAGSRYGQLAMLDHEVWYGGMAALLDVKDGFYPDDDEEERKLPFNTFEEATPDQILDECFETGFLAHYPIGLTEHLANVDRLFNRLAEKYRSRPKIPAPSKAELKEAYCCVAIDGHWHAAEELALFYGDRFVLNEREALAWRYKVTMEETRDLRVRVKLSNPAGAMIRDSIETIETNATYQNATRLSQEGVEPLSGVYKIELTFPEDPDLPILSDERHIVIGEAPLAFTTAQFEPATDDEIAAIEKKLPYRLCDDLKSWLKDVNGVMIQWPYIHLWNQLDDEAEAAFKAEIDALRKERWELAISMMTGLQKPWKIWMEYNDPPYWHDAARGLAESLERADETPHLQILYPVADTIGFESHGYCQIAAGSRRGAIVELLESRYILDALSQVQDGKRVVGRGKKAKTIKYPFETFAAASPDQIIDAWLGEDMIRLTDMDFAAFSRQVIEAHEAEFSRLYDKYC